MTQARVRVSAAWLALREPADAAARSTELVDEVERIVAGSGRTVIYDLACGTGSMARWLAPQLPGPQHWILYDWNTDLLSDAAAAMPKAAADGAAVTFETRPRNVTRLDPADLAGASLITTSALLDMLTADETQRLASECVAAGCPALLTISVVGRVELTPADPLDRSVAEAFNDHQRRTGPSGHRLLGPDAVALAADEFARLGAEVLIRPSPWRLGPAEATLAAEWFAGWLGAARDERPDLRATTAAYAQRRRDAAGAGRLAVTVHHQDLLVRPR